LAAAVEAAFRVEVGYVSIVLYVFSSLIFFVFFAFKASFNGEKFFGGGCTRASCLGFLKIYTNYTFAPKF
jgi:ABC-type branched-subunit amino acid transport system permease subunit